MFPDTSEYHEVIVAIVDFSQGNNQANQNPEQKDGSKVVKKGFPKKL
jgi:hypothetical protein